MLYFSLIIVLGTFCQQTFADEPEAIVGGTIAKPGEFPYQCSLHFNDNPYCGCSVINQVQILTAAHCVYNAQSYYANISIVTGTIYNQVGNTHAVKTARIHPDYRPSAIHSWMNDIAVISLQKPIKFDKHQSPIALATTAPIGGTQCVLAGWGAIGVKRPESKNLLKINTTLIDRKTCQSKVHVRLQECHICTFNTPGIGACHGDSGGPLVCNGRQVGIISFVRPCATGEPDIYTDVYHHRDFIRQAGVNA